MMGFMSSDFVNGQAILMPRVKYYLNIYKYKKKC